MNTPISPWLAQLQRLTAKALTPANAKWLLQKYANLFSADYQNSFAPRHGLQDLLHLEQITQADQQTVSLIKPKRPQDPYRLHFYSGQARYLDEYIPLLENLGLRVMDQMQFCFSQEDSTQFIKSFSIKAEKTQHPSLRHLQQRLLATLHAVMEDRVDNDALNKLCILAGMAWQDIDLLRAYRNYFLQLEQHTSKASIHRALVHNDTVAHDLFAYFEARFRPIPAGEDISSREEQLLSPLRWQLLNSLSLVAELNDDRILRTLFNLIDATVRSNFHWRRDHADYFIAFKINSLGVIDLPSPKPRSEIYVHAVDVQGIHLRAGKIARGGIRWSDRPDDFRTEILGLMQTQVSKNALIIPTGAKGGFVVKQQGVTKLKAAGQQAYLRLIRGLLDLTDNYQDGRIVQAAHIVAYDNPDPYLVVAADKGTASFSDIANAVAADYQFWLGDAFASGGSHGYDHKALGITARGAWECVKRHFLELGKNIQQEPFSVVGIGSMDGDVFGNALLLSPCIQLLAAFSGQHIFLDPKPIALDASFNERKRLFELSGSSWNDYDRRLISNGGGVYLRSDKDIPLSVELKQWLGIHYKSLDGESLIRYLLMAKVDLLWLGGIGTYVKASSEKNEEVGDRHNDQVRIDATQLNATVVGEGANLGFTQKARIEYALQGGRINTDAVDNSAGVDTSDHEVNLKILLMGLQKQKHIDDYQTLFTHITEPVCALVLANNTAQSLCLSLEQRRCQETPKAFLQWAAFLDDNDFLDKAQESFPSDKDVLARPGQILTRPELAILMAASKMYLTQQLQNTPCWQEETSLTDYFPEPIKTTFLAHLTTHPLANEIRATQLSNRIINQAGCRFLTLKLEQDEVNRLDWSELAACYLSFEHIINAQSLREAIAQIADPNVQYPLLIQLESVLLQFCQWALAEGQHLQPNPPTLARYHDYLNIYREILTVDSVWQKQALNYQQIGLSKESAEQLALTTSLSDFPRLVNLAEHTAAAFKTIVHWYEEARHYLGLDTLIEHLAQYHAHDHWEQNLAPIIQEELKQSLCLIIENSLAEASINPTAYLTQPTKHAALRRYQVIRQDIDNSVPTHLLPYIALSKVLVKLRSEQEIK
ncbi:MAG: NAD-glutamate dehydrogenase [Methylococcaceae bacterium]